MSVSLRTVAAQDSEFAYQVKKTTLAEYVWQLWGWDEAEQRRLHQRRFASQNFQVIVADVGILVVSKEPDCLRVNQLLVLPEYQGKGVGTACMRQVLDDAAGRRLPVRLKVLKVNRRASGFYWRLGFVDTGLDDTHVQMERPV